MTEIIDDKALEPVESETTPECNFATVGEVYDDGLTLIFDGQEEASEKRYKCNTSVRFSAGDRVRILKDSGTYVVEYVVGAPGEDILMPAGGSDGQFLTKDGSADYGAKWSDRSRELPDGGSTGQMLTKSSNTSYAVRWSDPPGRELPAGGQTGQMLVKTNTLDYQVHWTTPPVNHIPAGGQDGQMLVKNGSTAYALKWADVPTPTVSRLYQGSTNYVSLTTGRALVPHASNTTYAYSLGTSSLPWAHLYTGAGYTRLCTAAGRLGFFGVTPQQKQTLSLSYNNMGYSSVTENNMVTALNNLIGILRGKYGLIG